MFEDQVKLLDYYFFGVGIVSLVVAFVLSIKTSQPYYYLVIFYFVSFVISFMLNIVLIEKMKTIYVWDTKSYMTTHVEMAVVMSVLTVVSMIFFGETDRFVLYFIIVNFFLMLGMLSILILEYRYFKHRMAYSIVK